MNNWITQLFNTRNTRNVLRMFGRKRNNRGMMWASVLGLGISAAAAVGLGRNRNINFRRPVNEAMNNFKMKNTGQIRNFNALATEFAKELMPNQENKNNENK